MRGWAGGVSHSHGEISAPREGHQPRSWNADLRHVGARGGLPMTKPGPAGSIPSLPLGGKPPLAPCFCCDQTAQPGSASRIRGPGKGCPQVGKALLALRCCWVLPWGLGGYSFLLLELPQGTSPELFVSGPRASIPGSRLLFCVLFLPGASLPPSEHPRGSGLPPPWEAERPVA